MPFLLSAKKKFTLLGFDLEDEFERAVVANSKYLFGPEAVYIDIKKRVGSKDSYHKGIPEHSLWTSSIQSHQSYILSRMNF